MATYTSLTRIPEKIRVCIDPVEGAFVVEDDCQLNYTTYVPESIVGDLVASLKVLFGDSAGEAIFGIEDCMPNPVWMNKARASIARAEKAIE